MSDSLSVRPPAAAFTSGASGKSTSTSHVLNFLPSHALRFGDLDFVANHRLHLCEGDVALPCTPLQNPRPTHRGPVIVDSNALACRIDTYLGINPEPEQSWHVFYALANTFAQLSWGAPMPPEVEFWEPNVSLPSGMRDATTIFERKLARCSRFSSALPFQDL
jgi:hypothetical protein